MTESHAIQVAIGVVKRWARGGGNVDANTRAGAAKAVAQWEKLKAGAAAKRGGKLKEAIELAQRGLSPEDLAIVETVEAPVSFLFSEITGDEIGDLSLLEAAKPTPMSNTPRRSGESLTSWGNRLKAGDKALATAQAKKTRTRSGATSSNFEAKHPRGRGGEWTFTTGASGSQVRGIQRRVGAKADGQFGNLTKSAVMAYQRRHNLVVDGVVGAQTVAAMRGRRAKVKPGAMSASDKAWLAGHATHR